MNEMLAGAIVMASAVAGLFFLRFWRSTGDRFFLYFALSFFIEGFNRAVLTVGSFKDEHRPLFFLIRLIAYGLILFAIIDKNKRRDKGQ